MNETLWPLIVLILFGMGCLCFVGYPWFVFSKIREKYLDPSVDLFFKKHFSQNKVFIIILGLIYMFIFFIFTGFISLILLSLWCYLCGFTPIEGIPFVNHWYYVIPSLKGILDIS